MDNTDGMQIVLSPVQLAAVLSDVSVSEDETLTNRLWGGLGLVGGVAEMFGADPNTAVRVGMTVDLSIPIGFALATGAIRVIAVRGGRIRLAAHESVSGKNPRRTYG